MTGIETVEQDIVERMLTTGKALCWIVILVVDMQVVVAHSVHNLLAQQKVINKRLRCLARELHHHSGRSIGVHVCILACYIIRADIDDLLENLLCLGIAGDTALFAVGNILLSNVLAATLHELNLNHVLNSLHSHLWISLERDAVCNLTDQ